MAESELPDDLQRWTAKRRAALVLALLKGDTTVQEAARKHGLTDAEVRAEGVSCKRLQVLPCLSVV